MIDGAHNEEGVNALAEELNKRYSSKKKKLIFSALSDKKLDKMIQKLDGVADEITFVTFDYPRATKVEDLFNLSTNEINIIMTVGKLLLEKSFNPYHLMKY